MAKIYQDGTYLTRNSTWHEEDSPYKAKWINELIKNNSLNPNTVCEIGCGSGEILNQMSEEHGESVKFYGYEISPQAFKICKKKEKENLTLRFSDILKEKDKYLK